MPESEMNHDAQVSGLTASSPRSLQVTCVAAWVALALGLATGLLGLDTGLVAAETSPADSLFDPNRVIEVAIEIEEDDWDQLRTTSRSLIDALQNEIPESPFKYVRADVTVDGVRVENVGIRKKGFLGSLDDRRPSLKIRFDKYEDQEPFGDLDRLTLNNNKQDRSRLSQYLSYKLFRDSGAVASRCNFANVTVNGQPLGIYSNVESIKPPMLRRGFGDGSGSLIEGTVTDLLAVSVHRFEQKSGPSPTGDLKRLTEILAAETLDLEKLDGLINVDAFTRFWATESLIGFWDGYTHNQNNFFVYKNPADFRYYFLPWGTDSAFTYEVPSIIDRIRFKSAHTQSAIANRLYHDPEGRQLYRDALDQLLEDHWDEEKLLAEVDRVVELIEPHLVIDESAFRSGVSGIRRFVQSRRRVLQVELDRWPMELNFGPRSPGFTEELGRGKATFSTQWYDKTPSEPEQLGKTKLEFQLNDDEVQFKRIGVIAEPSKDRNAMRNGNRPPTLVFSGNRDPGGRQLSLAMTIPTDSFHPSEKPIEATGILIEGGMMSFLASMMLDPSSIRLISASVKLDQASMEVGAPVSGEVEFRIMRFAGGKSPKRTWVPDKADESPSATDK